MTEKPARDPFLTFKVWRRAFNDWLEPIDALGRQLEGIVGKAIPVRVRKGAIWTTDMLQARPWVGFLLFFTLACSRAHFWLTNPQFYIEDGKEFYARAFNEGIGTLTREYAAYYHVVARGLALVAAALPVRQGPLAMEFLALIVQAGVAAFIASSRLAKQIPSSALRFMLALMVIGDPYSNELFANVTHVQWYLGILSLGIIFAEPYKGWFGRTTDFVVVALCCVTGPLAPVLAVLGWLRWRRDKSRWVLAAICTVAAGITIVSIIQHPRTGINSDASLPLLERIVAYQVVIGPIQGFHAAYGPPFEPLSDLKQFSLSVFAMAVLFFGLRRSPTVVQALAVVGAYCILTCLDSQSSWVLLGSPGVGERYFVYLDLVLVFCLYRLSVAAKYSVSRWCFRAILLVVAFSTVHEWVYDPPFSVFNFQPQIDGYRRLKPGQSIEIATPIDRKSPNAYWVVTLKKKS